MPFEFAKAALLQLQEKRLDYLGVTFLGAQDALFRKHTRSAASVEDEGQPPPAVSAVADVVGDDDDWG